MNTIHNYTIVQDKGNVTFTCKYCHHEFTFRLSKIENIGVYFTLANHIRDNHFE